MMSGNILSPKGMFKNFISFKNGAPSAVVKKENNGDQEKITDFTDEKIVELL